MRRFLRIAHRGWLRRAITVATFGYFPLNDDAVSYIVSGDVEVRFLALKTLPIVFSAATVGITQSDGVANVRLSALANGKIRRVTDAVRVEL